MDNQHKKISGCRDLSQEEIDLMNEIKAQGLALDKLVGKVLSHITDQYEHAGQLALATNDRSEIHRLEAAQPDEWLRDARRKLQIAMMELTRAVAQPGGF